MKKKVGYPLSFVSEINFWKFRPRQYLMSTLTSNDVKKNKMKTTKKTTISHANSMLCCLFKHAHPRRVGSNGKGNEREKQWRKGEGDKFDIIEE